MKITPQEIADWRQNPTTCRVMEYFKKKREDLKEGLVRGDHTLPDASASMQKTANVIGNCQAYEDILGISYEDFEGEYDLLIKEEEEQDEFSNI